MGGGGEAGAPGLLIHVADQAFWQQRFFFMQGKPLGAVVTKQEVCILKFQLQVSPHHFACWDLVYQPEHTD